MVDVVGASWLACFKDPHPYPSPKERAKSAWRGRHAPGSKRDAMRNRVKDDSTRAVNEDDFER